MNIYVYAKSTERISSYEAVIDAIRDSRDELFVSVENKRCFRELENIKRELLKEDIVLIGSLASFGMNETEMANQLNWFVENSAKLVICNIVPTYEYGVTQPMNKAVLMTILQSILKKDRNIVEMPKNRKSNAGRSRVEFPDNWDELYDKWIKKEISSKEFIMETGLKKATFYNLMTEYKELQELNEKYVQKYKMGS